MTLITCSRRTPCAGRRALRTLFAMAPSLVPALAGAQKPSGDGALDLVLPTGARAVARTTDRIVRPRGLRPPAAP